VSENRRIRLERVGLARARAIVAGDLRGVDAGPGWPHADTLDGLRIEAEHATRDEETGFLVLLTGTGQVVGDAGWKGGPDGSGTAEIGYGLSPHYRGQGLGTELVAELAAWASAQPGVRRVRAEVLAGNEPSLRALRRNGFVEVGRRDGEVVLERPVTSALTGTRKGPVTDE
jgi:[ribosomal protein S5]-alanine N-acetyltransferase